MNRLVFLFCLMFAISIVSTAQKFDYIHQYEAYGNTTDNNTKQLLEHNDTLYVGYHFGPIRTYIDNENKVEIVAPNASQHFVLICYKKSTGERLWHRTIEGNKKTVNLMAIHPQNGHLILGGIDEWGSSDSAVKQLKFKGVKTANDISFGYDKEGKTLSFLAEYNHQGNLVSADTLHNIEMRLSRQSQTGEICLSFTNPDQKIRNKTIWNNNLTTDSFYIFHFVFDRQLSNPYQVATSQSFLNVKRMGNTTYINLPFKGQWGASFAFNTKLINLSGLANSHQILALDGNGNITSQLEIENEDAYEGFYQTQISNKGVGLSFYRTPDNTLKLDGKELSPPHKKSWAQFSGFVQLDENLKLQNYFTIFDTSGVHTVTFRSMLNDHLQFSMINFSKQLQIQTQDTFIVMNYSGSGNAYTYLWYNTETGKVERYLQVEGIGSGASGITQNTGNRAVGNSKGSFTYLWDGAGSYNLNLDPNGPKIDKFGNFKTLKLLHYNCEPLAIFSFKTNRDTLFITNQSTLNANYTWTYGDGNGSSDRNPLPHIYKEATSYLLNLEVTNDCGTAELEVPLRIHVAGIDKTQAHSLTAYPNPAQEFLMVENTSPQSNLQWYMIDNQGKTISIQPIQFTESWLQFDISRFAQGVYVLTGMEKDQPIYSGKIVVK